MSNEITAEPNKTYICARPVTIILPDSFQPKETAIICLVPKFDSKGFSEFFPVICVSKSDILIIPSITVDGELNTYKEIKFRRKKKDSDGKDVEGFNVKLGSNTTKLKQERIDDQGAYWSGSTETTLQGDIKGAYVKTTLTSILKNSFQVSAIKVVESVFGTIPPTSTMTTYDIVMGAVKKTTTVQKFSDTTHTYTNSY